MRVFIFAGAALLAGCLTREVLPTVDVDAARHANLASAQVLVRDAWQKVDDAQVANGHALGGHAARAKDLLVQAGTELSLAADVADRR
jgi:hypothetical protein